MSYDTNFMCSCDEEGKKECNDLYQWALEDLKATPETFLTSVVYGLEWKSPEGGSGANISSIMCDQWCYIGAEGDQEYAQESSKYKPESRFQAGFMCDQVEHGLAAIWKAWKEYLEDNREIEVETSED